jgi:sugar phosphate isomerase/epimerase
VKVAISSIAWSPEEEPAAARLLAALGVRGVETVPGRVCAEPAKWKREDAARARSFWADHGVEIVAMQALLFGTKDLGMFGDAGPRERMRVHLSRVVELGGALGAKALVFGSPKNRLVGALDARAIETIALPFFRDLGRVAQAAGTCLCIEPNPPRYGADWIHDVKAARALVEAVDQPGFGLHVDGGALHLAGEGAEELAQCAGIIRHFHASEPDLIPLCASSLVAHAQFAKALRAQAYPNWVSIEMRRPDGTPALAAAAEALGYAQRIYGG